MRDYDDYGNVSPWRLKEKEIKKVIISEGVTSVGAYAFYSKWYTDFTSDGMPYDHCDSVLREVIIPEGVTSIGDSAFCGCELLSEVLIPNSVKSIGKGAFYGLYSLNTVIIPEGVIFIDQDAFSGCRSLKYLVIPESLASMGQAPCPFNTYSENIVIFTPLNCPWIGYGPLNYPAKGRSIEEIASKGFLHSPEFISQNLSNKEFVIRMYETFLNRDPDEAGLNDWVSKLEKGDVTRDSLVYGFTNSTEFGKLKAEYNLP